jgi:TRAP-type C4-dicarboxylate transport system substrate-binding protein
MIKAFATCALLALVLLTSAAVAESIKIKLAFITSDGSQFYLYVIKPFVDAVNTEASGLIKIEVYFSGVLGGNLPQQPQLVLDGAADIAFIVPGQSPHQFSDNAVLELPGLFHDAREATLAYSGLIHANALRGYEEFFVIGAFSGEPETIHSRKRLTSLAELKDMKIRTTSVTEVTALERLGAVTDMLPIPQAADAISAGSIDGATLPPSALSEFGIGRLTTYHYLLSISAAPLALVMSRKKLDSLPEQAKSLIRKYSGEWMAARFLERWQVLEKEELKRIKSDARRTVTFPSRTDLEAARAAFKSVDEQWAAKSPHNFELLGLVEIELAKIRADR